MKKQLPSFSRQLRGNDQEEYAIFRVRQDREYIPEFDRQTEKYLKGE